MCFKVRRKEILFEDVKNVFSLSPPKLLSFISVSFSFFFSLFHFFFSLSLSLSLCIRKSRTIFLSSLSSSSCFPLLSKFFSRALPSFFVLSLSLFQRQKERGERKKEKEQEREREEGESKRRSKRGWKEFHSVIIHLIHLLVPHFLITADKKEEELG